MTIRCTQRLLDVLVDLADYRMLSLSQVAHLHFQGKRQARRRMQQLLEEALVAMLPGCHGMGGGRPESVYGISKAGLKLLKDQGLLDERLTIEQVGGEKLSPQAAHQRLLGWFRIHLVHLCRNCSRLESAVMTCNGPLALDANTGMPGIRIAMTHDTDTAICFTPDAAILITDRSQQKSVLFFLEVDMGTEAVSSDGGGDIREKILRYKHYFRTGGYKQFEQIWGAPLNGFRLLFLTNNASRHAALCALTRSLAPSGFVWITTAEQLFADGISGAIWTAGGQSDQGRRSILGRLAQSCPLPQLGD